MQAHILIADGDGDIRHLSALILRQHGYQVLEAANVGETLSLIRTMQPDLLVFAMDMANHDGRTLGQMLDADSSMAAVPAITLVTQNHAAMVEPWLRDGIHDYMVKPFAPHDLMNHVERMLTAVHGRLE